MTKVPFDQLPKNVQEQVKAKLAAEGDERAVREITRKTRGLSPGGDLATYRHQACGTLIATANDGGGLTRHANGCEHREGDYRAVLPPSH